MNQQHWLICLVQTPGTRYRFCKSIPDSSLKMWSDHAYRESKANVLVINVINDCTERGAK